MGGKPLFCGSSRRVVPDAGARFRTGKGAQTEYFGVFLCSLLLPLGALELDFSDILQTSQQEKSYELSEEITQEVNTEVYQMMEGQIEGEVQNFLSQKGITPVQINIDILQQGDSVMLMLDLLLEEKDRPMQAWVEEQMSSDLVQVSIHYTEGEKNDG